MQIKPRIILRLPILQSDMDLIILHRSEAKKSSNRGYFARPVTVEGEKDRARVAEMAEEFSRVNVAPCTGFKHS